MNGRLSQFIDNRELILQDLHADGFESVEDIEHTAKSLQTSISHLLESEAKDISPIFYSQGKTLGTVLDRKIGVQFLNTQNPIDQLKLLSNLPIFEATECILRYGKNEARIYIENRIKHYEQLIASKSKEEYFDEATALSNIHLGLRRDILYAAMFGTPELTIYETAKKWCKYDNLPTTHFPVLKGYESGIFEGYIGYTYPQLQKIYQLAEKRVRRSKNKKELSNAEIEHKAILDGAHILKNAMDYNPADRTPHSPYASFLPEAIAWVQLGEGVKKQFRGMRQKIRGIPLYNIGRFIGKAGDNPYGKERKKLHWQIQNFDTLIEGKSYEDPLLMEYAYRWKALKESEELTEEERTEKQHELDTWYEAHKTTFLGNQNKEGLLKKEQVFLQEQERLQNKHARTVSEIKALELPEEEERLQLQNKETEFQNTMASLEKEYREAKAYLEQRSAPELLKDLQTRQQVVQERYENRKSLAQRALDLHFFTNGRKSELWSRGVLDWINTVPFGTIKRCHKMMQQGAKRETIVAYAVATVLWGSDFSQSQLKDVQDLVERAKQKEADKENKEEETIWTSLHYLITYTVGQQNGKSKPYRSNRTLDKEFAKSNSFFVSEGSAFFTGLDKEIFIGATENKYPIEKKDLKNFALTEETPLIKEECGPFLQSIIEHMQISTFGELCTVMAEQKDYILWLQNNYYRATWNLDKSDTEHMKTICKYISKSDFYLVKKLGHIVPTPITLQTVMEMISLLESENESEWYSDHYPSNSKTLKKGVETFGLEPTWTYITSMERTDALFHIKIIWDIQRLLTIPLEEFCAHIHKTLLPEEVVPETYSLGTIDKVLNIFTEKTHTPWSDLEALIPPFIKETAVFGFEQVLEHITHPELTGRDALSQIEKIREVQHSTGLSPEKFETTIGELHKAQNPSLEVTYPLSLHTTYEVLALFLQNTEGTWNDIAIIFAPFMAGMAIFGYEKMSTYAKKPGVTGHDALYQFKKILEMYTVSGLSADQFYHNILAQVHKDSAQYDTGTAYHHINTISNNFSSNVEQTLEKAKAYNITKLQELLIFLKSPAQVFSSWKYLKKYYELSQLLQKTSLLKELEGLGATKDKNLARYIETLAFHPNINMEAVIKFWKNPASFLSAGDGHAVAVVHNNKKPSNYTDIPNLDLTATELRNALLEGALDTIQAFSPLEIIYAPFTEDSVEKDSLDTRALLSLALGSYQKKIPGKAKDPKKLFATLNTLFKQKKLVFNEYLKGTDIPEDFELEIHSLVEEEMPPEPSQPKGKRYKAKIALKSDPDAVVAGNDTSCCMPFGSGKNNVYTFNPVCGLFVIQEERGDGNWRTMAQSVLTKDKDIKKSFASVLAELQKEDPQHLHEILPNDFTRETENLIACDNIEVAPNFMNKQDIIALLYKDFLAEYLDRYGKKEKLQSNKVVIGMGYTDAMKELPQESNTYVPLAPVSYSDKTGDRVFTMFPQKTEVFTKSIREEKRPDTIPTFSSTIPGILPLTFQDALPVSFIEGKAYQSNTTLMTYLHNMENGLIAKDITNAYKHRPNLSVKFRDEQQKVLGYLLAYEGVHDDTNKPVIYVSDIASDLTTKGVGGKLMMGFFEQYKKQYIEKSNLLPIYAEMREGTSYDMVQKKLEDINTYLGVTLEIEEVGTEEKNGNTMHHVYLRVIDKSL